MPTPNVGNGMLAFIDWSDPGWLSFIVVAVVMISGVVTWSARTYTARRAEARLITSRFCLIGNGTSLPFQYEITVHNGSAHPLRFAEIHFWDGEGWQLRLARRPQTTDPVIPPNDDGHVLVRATTTDLIEFKRRHYLRYEDSHNRTWHRSIGSPDFLSRSKIKGIRNQVGAV